MGTPLGPKYIPYTYMDPLGVARMRLASERGSLTGDKGDSASNLGLHQKPSLDPLIGDTWSLIVGT